MSGTCKTCQHWSGALDACMGLCRLHRDCHSFRAVGRDCTCPSFAAEISESTTSGGAIVTGENKKGPIGQKEEMKNEY